MKRFLTLFFLALFIFPSISFAEFIGINKEEFKPHYRPQMDPLWCWAASAEMVLSHQGVKIPQALIVQRVKGASVSTTGNFNDMVNSINGVFNSSDGKEAVVSGQFVMSSPLPTVLYNQLRQNNPVILTYQAGPYIGHAVVITGIEATVDSRSGVQITKIYVFDPFAYDTVNRPWGGFDYVYNESLQYKEYALQMTQHGLRIPPGIITGVILVDGTKL